jgi:hypothetical protein
LVHSFQSKNFTDTNILLNNQFARFLLGVVSAKLRKGQEVVPDYRARLSSPSDGSIERSVVSFGKYKSVTIDHNYSPVSTNWRKSWPDGIKLISRLLILISGLYVSDSL